MPIYEYECAGCGEHIETWQRMSDAPLVECPKCHQAELRKLISLTSFHLKGSGWYATDYGHKGDGPSGGGAREKAGTSDGPDSSDKADRAGDSEKSEIKRSEGEKSSPKVGGAGSEQSQKSEKAEAKAA